MKKLLWLLLLPVVVFSQTTFMVSSTVPGITLAGTASTTMTFPTTSATIARTDAAQTFTGTQTFGALLYTTLNGNTWAAGTGTLSIAAGKTLTASNSLTLAGTDTTTMTFPGVSDTVDTLGAAQTFTAVKTFTNSDLKLLGSSTGATTFTSANAGASAFTLTFPAVTDTVVTQNALNGTTPQAIFATTLVFTNSFKNNVTNNILTTAQTAGIVIASGFGTSPAISQNNGSASFSVNVGTGGTATSGVVTLPAATHAWGCFAADTGATPTGRTEQTAGTTTSITLTNYSRTTGSPVAWTASEIVQVGCWAN